MSLVFTFISNGGFSLRQNLDEALDDIERAIRFSEDESALRNTITRIHFFLDSNPQEFTVEFGPDDKFIIPAAPPEITSKSLKDEEIEKKKTEDLNKKFSSVKEFSEKKMEVPDSIKIIGIGSSMEKELIIDFHASLYVYPSGEKDAGFIIVSSDAEMVGLSIEPFSRTYTREYIKIEKSDSEELIDTQLRMAKEMYEKWLKE
jgi:hypothetical protein